MTLYRLGEIAPIIEGTVEKNDKYWLLNLDMVERETGRIIGYNFVSENEIGNSTVPFDTGNVLYSKLRPYLNKVVLPQKAGYATSEMVPLRPDTSIITREYLTYLLRSPMFVSFINSKTSGAKMPRAKLAELKKFEIKCPSIVEQKIITDRFDELLEAIGVCESIIDKLNMLCKSRFVEMFVGKNYPLVSVDELSLGKGEYGAQSASIAYDASRPRYVRITDINDDGTLNNDFVSSSNIDDDKQYKLSYGDFLFARMGATVGKTYAYKEGNQIYAGYLIRYKLNLDKITPEYMYAYTRLGEYWNWVKLNQSGAAQPGINAKKYGSLRIPVPPLSEQKAFQTFVAQVDKSKSAVLDILEKLKTLQKSLMQEYFC